MSKIATGILGCAAVFAMATQSVNGAAIVARYEFTSGSLASSDTDTSTASSFSNGNGITTSTALNDETVGSDKTGSSLTSNDYFEFTITPAVNTPMDYVSLAFDAGFGGTAVQTSSTASFDVRSSLDVYAATIGTVQTETYQKVTSDDQLPLHAHSINLSATQYQNVTQPITFRIYLYDTTSDPLRKLRLDNVAVTAEVPEPATATLVGVGTVAIAGLRRRRSC
jgi:hypothetical protein